MNTAQQLAAAAAALLVAWYLKNPLAKWVSSLFGPRMGTESELRIEAITALEDARANAEALGNSEAVACIELAARAIYGGHDAKS